MSSSGVMLNVIWKRCISTTSLLNSKKNFRKFPMINKRGTSIEKRQRFNKGIHDPRGVRPVGAKDSDGVFHLIPEMVPELIVPDLTGFQLKPYVSYRVPDVIQSPFSPKDLFDVVYSEKITKDFKEGKLDENGNSSEPSDEEKLTPQQAFINARKTGSDIF